MCARLRRQPFDTFEIYHQQPGKTRQREWIEGLIFSHPGKVTQTERAQFELFSLFSGRKKKALHAFIILRALRASVVIRSFVDHHGDTQDTETSRAFAARSD